MTGFLLTAMLIVAQTPQTPTAPGKVPPSAQAPAAPSKVVPAPAAPVVVNPAPTPEPDPAPAPAPTPVVNPVVNPAPVVVNPAPVVVNPAPVVVPSSQCQPVTYAQPCAQPVYAQRQCGGCHLHFRIRLPQFCHKRARANCGGQVAYGYGGGYGY